LFLCLGGIEKECKGKVPVNEDELGRHKGFECREGEASMVSMCVSNNFSFSIFILSLIASNFISMTLMQYILIKFLRSAKNNMSDVHKNNIV